MSYIFFDTDLNIAPYWDVVTTGKSVDFVLSNKSLTNPNLTKLMYLAKTQFNKNVKFLTYIVNLASTYLLSAHTLHY